MNLFNNYRITTLGQFLYLAIMETGNQSKYVEAEGPLMRSTAHVYNGGHAGIPKSVVAPVFELTRRLRFMEPSVDSILIKSKTQLDGGG
jgi:hypothetical protein